MLKDQEMKEYCQDITVIGYSLLTLRKVLSKK